MKAMVLFGVPPEQYWPYELARFDAEPTSFCFSFAQNYQAVEYFRLDPPGTSATEVLAAIKRQLAAGLPAMFASLSTARFPGQATAMATFPCPSPATRCRAVTPCWRWATTMATRSAANRRAVDSQFLGQELGRAGLRLAAVRLRHARTGQ